VNRQARKWRRVRSIEVSTIKLRSSDLEKETEPFEPHETSRFYTKAKPREIGENEDTKPACWKGLKETDMRGGGNQIFRQEGEEMLFKKSCHCLGKKKKRLVNPEGKVLKKGKERILEYVPR